MLLLLLTNVETINVKYLYMQGGTPLPDNTFKSLQHCNTALTQTNRALFLQWNVFYCYFYLVIKIIQCYFSLTLWHNYSLDDLSIFPVPMLK